MKILIFSHEYPPLNGGAGTYVSELSYALALLGHKVRLIVGNTLDRHGDAREDDSAKNAGIDISRHNWIYSSKMWFLKDQKLYRSIIKDQQDADIIIFANYTSHLVAHKLTKHIKKKYLIVLHGDDIDYFCNRPRLKDKIMISTRKMSAYIKGAHKVISVSRYLEKIFLGYMPEMSYKSRVVLHGIKMPENISKQDRHRAKEEFERSISSSGQNRKILTYVSRFAQDKGQDLMVQVFRHLLEHDKSYGLIFIGDGETKPVIEKIVEESSVSSSIMFTGAIPRIEVYTYLALAKVNIFLSTRYGETFGIVNIESMAVGTPAIALDIGGGPEAIDHGITGQIITERDPEDIANSIHSLVSDEVNYLRLQENALNVAHSYYNSTRMAIETIGR